MTPYMMMLVFQEKHGFDVMVDKGIKNWIEKFFVLPNSDRIPVLETYFCAESLEKIKRSMLNYTKNDPNLTEGELLEMRNRGPLCGQRGQKRRPATGFQIQSLSPMDQ